MGVNASLREERTEVRFARGGMLERCRFAALPVSVAAMRAVTAGQVTLVLAPVR